MHVMKTRREIMQIGAGSLAAPVLLAWTKSRQLPFDADVRAMKPGDYTWAPQRSADGPVVLIVSLPEQRAFVYRNGVRIAVTTCSTGRKGHRTPTGVFTVLQKDKDHVSSTYKGAKMPYMERLTWSGIALHAGNLPGYPASHGCVRMPLEFAHKLFTITHLGVVVIVADGHSQPEDVVHPGTLLPTYARVEAIEAVAKIHQRKLPPKHRHEAGHRPAKALVSIADKQITIFENGHIRARGPITLRGGRPVGDHVFVLKPSGSGGQLVWSALTFRHEAGAKPGSEVRSVIGRLTTTPEVASVMQTLMHPGFTLVVTDRPAPATTRSNRGFVIATHFEPEGWQTKVFSR